MFLRLLLSFIRPSNEQLRCKACGKFVQLKIWLYQFLLKRLLQTYLHYAISDTIIINNGNIKIVHEFRDLGFESELVRNKIDFKSEIICHSIPMSIRKSKATCHFAFFKFKNLLSLYIEGKELFIKHDEACSIDGTIEGKLKSSSKNNRISLSVIEILSSYDRTQGQESCVDCSTISNVKKTGKTANLPHKPNNSKHAIFGKDKDILPITLITDSRTNKKENDYQSESIEKRGFDIDTSF